MSAVNHVARGKGIPPFLLLHTAEHLENRTGLQAHVLASALALNGKVPTKIIAVSGKTHETLDSDLGLPDDQPTQEIFALIDREIKAAEGRSRLGK